MNLLKNPGLVISYSPNIGAGGGHRYTSNPPDCISSMALLFRTNHRYELRDRLSERGRAECAVPKERGGAGGATGAGELDSGVAAMEVRPELGSFGNGSFSWLGGLGGSGSCSSSRWRLAISVSRRLIAFS